MDEPNPGIRRLCVAATAGPARLLASACHSADVGRLCITVERGDGIEMAFAPPGIDEAVVVSQLIGALDELVRCEPGRPGSALAAFHVGITRIDGAGFGGEAVARTRALLFDRAIRTRAIANGGKFVAILSESLYHDLRTEGLPGQVWQNIRTADAWIWCSEALNDSRSLPREV